MDPLKRQRTISYGLLSIEIRDRYGVDRFDWPPYSPDLNPTKNVWSNMKNALAKNPLKNRSDMIKKIK